MAEYRRRSNPLAKALWHLPDWSGDAGWAALRGWFAVAGLSPIRDLDGTYRFVRCRTGGKPFDFEGR